MGKRFTKIICAATAAVCVLGAATATGCSKVYDVEALGGDYSGEVVSNGGFAVRKGDYIYFINGVEQNTADNEFGKPVKGAVYRISYDNLENHNYNSVDKVVNNIVYSADYSGGIFIYGDYIYYGTPSTEKNSAGETQNAYLDMKRTKLDGTETMKDYYVQFPTGDYQYRYVEEGGVVYLLYLAKGETLYGEEDGVDNLHSYNTETGKDTLLAYDVGSVTFDSENKENPRVYYTMSVYNYTTDQSEPYNQIYTVKADATEDKFEGKLDSDTVDGWKWDDEKDRYINCGDLVFDGIGYINGVNGKTPFNYLPDDEDAVNDFTYTYTIKNYQNDTLFYTRKSSNSSAEPLYIRDDGEEYAPIDGNAAASSILNDGSSAENYKFIFGGSGLEKAIVPEGSQGISVNVFDGGKFQEDISIKDGSKYYKILNSGSATLLNVDDTYLYYSVSGGNGYTINRINYTGSVDNYEPLPTDDEVSDYVSVKVLDLDAYSGWYAPEFFGDFLIFASATTNMTSFNEIMVFDFDGMSNADIKALNEEYEKISETISDVFGDTEVYPTDEYANLQQVLRYAFYSIDKDLAIANLKERAEILNANVEEGGNPVYSEETIKLAEEFFTPSEDNEWKDFTATKTVNGKEVYKNTREYYYSILGELSEDEVKAYQTALMDNYLSALPEEEPTVTWWQGLNRAAKVSFVIGMLALGALAIGGVAYLIVWLNRRAKKENGGAVRRRIKVDTTDDKNIDVYNAD